jgi:ferredoxin
MIAIDREKCCGCNYCAIMCAQEALFYQDYDMELDQNKCELCGACVYYCPSGAIQMIRSD